MKKIILIIIALIYFVNLYSQISINQNDMPNVNDTFRLSTTTTITHDLSETGEDYFWDFSDLIPINQRIDTFVAVSSTLSVYYLVFGIYLDPNKATIATKNPNSPSMIQQVQVSESYDFFKEASDYYSKVGFGAQINSIPVPVKYDVPERYYTFPLTYQTNDSSNSTYGFTVPGFGYYGQNIKRQNYADGWGTIITPYGTFDVIRIKSTINLTDTFYSDSAGYGTTIPRSTEYEYKWIAKNMGIPILKITERNFIYSAEYQDSLRSTIVSNNVILQHNIDFKIFPNPTTKTINLDLPDNFEGLVEIYTINSQKLFSKTTSSSNKSIDLNLENGTYFIKISSNDEVMIKPFVISNN